MDFIAQDLDETRLSVCVAEKWDFKAQVNGWRLSAVCGTKIHWSSNKKKSESYAGICSITSEVTLLKHQNAASVC